MWDFNQVIFQGRVTDDVELKETPNGKKPYCWFSVANNTPKRNQDGSYDEYTNFFNLVLFDEAAVRNCKKLWKGRRVMVLGKVIQNKWTDPNGGKHDELKIKVDRMMFDPLTRDEKIKHGLVSPEENNQKAVAMEENPFNEENAVPVVQAESVERSPGSVFDYGFEDIY